MHAEWPVVRASKSARVAGWVVGGLPALFLMADGAARLFKPAPVVETPVGLGYPEGVIVGMGVVLLACTALYEIPKTSVLGAILLTGYLGGAVATHVRVGAGWSPVLFPAAFGVLLWAGLAPREPRLWSLVPLRSSSRPPAA